ncbi:LysE family transporter [uncultured Nocardioides sp.]|uniref:LysE family transporter n=1 Tax=uncultured Nocardioides sp. TaxID=198441 RepID=UPI000C41B2FB|nr:LysE family transporter [uncultured Nocardioides sp.]MAO79740.1 lysine transporter LysE [Nocardioides sp.]
MLEVVVSGLVTGLAIAVPIGAVGAFLVTLTARTSWRVGSAAALGVATVDGVYAAAAVLGGAALAGLLAPVADALRVVSGLVLLGIAALTALRAWSRRSAPARSGRVVGPRAAYLLFVGITAVNPTTVVYFAAVVLGNRDLVDGPVEGLVFVAAAFAASALWQLGLALAGAGLGRTITGPRGRLVTGLVSAVVVAGLAVRTILG